MLTSQDFIQIEKQANKLYNNLELEIIQEIAERIANVGYANTVVVNDIRIAQEMGILYQDVISLVAKHNNTSEDKIKNIFLEAGAKSLKSDDKIYKEAGLNPKGLSTSMLQQLEATANKTHNNLSNLTMTTASTSQTQFIDAMNKAYMEVSTGVKSYSQSIIDTIKEIASQGAYIEYPSGQHRSLESAVRTNIITSVNQTSGKLQLLRADEMGWDLMEISAHGGARPEHAEWQGKIVSRSGQKGYLNFKDIGYGTATGFQGVNCRHTWFPYYKGSTLTYTNKELRELKNETVKYNGKKISKYDATQIQRKIERQIRQDKKDIVGLQGILTSNNKDDKLIEETKINLINAKTSLSYHNSLLEDFVEQTEFRKDNSRLFVYSTNNRNLDIAEPLNKIIQKQPKQETSKKIIQIVDKYDKQGKIKIDYLNNKPFRYSKDEKKVKVNPNHPDFDSYNIREAIAHEISHMIDAKNNISKDNQLIQKIDNLEQILLKQKDKLNNILDSKRFEDNMFISDLFGGITKNQIRGEWSHPDKYWKNNNDRLSEIVSNIETIYLKKDKEAINLINSISEFKEIFKEVVKKYGKII